MRNYLFRHDPEWPHVIYDRGWPLPRSYPSTYILQEVPIGASAGAVLVRSSSESHQSTNKTKCRAIIAMRSQWEPGVMPGEDPDYLRLPKSFVSAKVLLDIALEAIQDTCD